MMCEYIPVAACTESAHRLLAAQGVQSILPNNVLRRIHEYVKAGRKEEMNEQLA